MLNFKRTVSVFLVLLLSSYAIVAKANSWMLGFEGGYGSRTYKVNATTVNASPFVTAATGGLFPMGATIASDKKEFTDNGTIWGIMLGYQWDMHPVWVFSLELRGTLDNISEENQWHYADSLGGGNQITAYVKYDRSFLFEFSGTLGLKANRKWLPYVRFGVVTSSDEMQFASQLFNGILFAAQDNMSQSDRLYGWLVGVGVEYPLFRDSILKMLRSSVVRAEYNYTRNERIIMEDVLPPLNGEYTARPHMHMFKLALVFKHSTR